MPSESFLREVFDRSQGHCHFCGDSLVFKRRGWAGNLNGYWEVDHVIQRDKGGRNHSENYLAACTACNRLRWHRKGADMRYILKLGLIASDEVRRRTSIGKILAHKLTAKAAENKHRRTIQRTSH